MSSGVWANVVCTYICILYVCTCICIFVCLNSNLMLICKTWNHRLLDVQSSDYNIGSTLPVQSPRHTPGKHHSPSPVQQELESEQLHGSELIRRSLLAITTTSEFVLDVCWPSSVCTCYSSCVFVVRELWAVPNCNMLSNSWLLIEYEIWAQGCLFVHVVRWVDYPSHLSLFLQWSHNIFFGLHVDEKLVRHSV